MATRITISIPDALAAEIKEIRPYLKVSQVCQVALAQAVLDVRAMKAAHPDWGLLLNTAKEK